jgi:hypothetical protein
MKNIFSKHAAYALAALVLFAVSSCSDSTDAPEIIPVTEGGKFRIEFDNVVGDRNLVLNSVTYQNAAKEDFTVTKLDYFISNIKLKKADGTVYTVPQDSSYFLIKESVKASQFVTLNNVPEGDYKEIEFMVGVDSLRNTADISKRKGVLDPGGSMASDGMYWEWNSGYIFLKLEGVSSVTTSINRKFYYHIGLFGGYEKRTVNNTRIVTIPFGNLTAPVSIGGSTPEVHLLVDVLKVFNGPGTNLSIAEFGMVMGSQEAKSQQIANNYASMFTIDHIH